METFHATDDGSDAPNRTAGEAYEPGTPNDSGHVSSLRLLGSLHDEDVTLR